MNPSMQHGIPSPRLPLWCHGASPAFMLPMGVISADLTERFLILLS